MRFFVTVFVLMFAISSISIAQEKDDKQEKLKKLIVAGKKLAEKNNCMVCHANQTLAPAYADVIDKYEVKEVEKFQAYLAKPTSSGKYPAPMPPVEVSKNEAAAILLYLKAEVKKAEKK